MKKIVLAAVMTGTALILAGLSTPEATHHQNSTNSLAVALDMAHEAFAGSFEQFEKSTFSYRETATAFRNGKASLSTLRDAHLETRIAFKGIEYMAEQLDPQLVKLHINGPPLLSVEPKVPEVRVLEPEGLQVLDELVFAENPVEEAEQIVALTQTLAQKVSEIRPYLSTVGIDHRIVFEGARSEIIRIFSLGLTGFDTPGSLHAIPEAAAALEALREALEGYLTILKDRDETLADELNARLENGIDYLQQEENFAGFDRLYFLKNYANPLYRQLTLAQRVLQIETIDEVSDLPHAVNSRSTGLFDENFLQAYYFINTDKGSITPERVALGKLLFFDPVLSDNLERSCASCHQPDKAFTDGLNKSLALDGRRKIQRNAPTVVNSVFAESFFYDLREEFMERQIKHVVLDAHEFNTDFQSIIKKLSKSAEYRNLFEQAYADYPKYQLSKWSVSDALAQYVASLTSMDSPFDQYVRGESATYDEAATRGFNLFMGKAACGTCHFAPTFSGLVPPHYKESESEVLGVPATKDTLNPVIDPDLGRIANGRPEDNAWFYAGSFKTPTLRNVALTGPYMHNGVYDSLEEVMDFYNRGGGAGMGMKLEHQTLGSDPLELNEQEVSDIIAFMETLTDTTGMTAIPVSLPAFEDHPEWNDRPIGGSY